MHAYPIYHYVPNVLMLRWTLQPPAFSEQSVCIQQKDQPDVLQADSIQLAIQVFVYGFGFSRVVLPSRANRAVAPERNRLIIDWKKILSEAFLRPKHESQTARIVFNHVALLRRPLYNLSFKFHDLSVML